MCVLKIKFLLLLSLVFCSQSVLSQDFLSIDKDLLQLEKLIENTIINTEEQQKLLNELKMSLDESNTLIASYESIIQERENLTTILREQLKEMSETYKMQSSLSAKYEKKSRFWRTFTVIAIPVTAIISGSIVWFVKN